MDIYAQTAAAFSSLDFSDENARLAEIKTRLDDTTRAIEAGESRMQEIHRTIAEARGPDGDAVADALLAHGDAALAASASRTGEQLKEEKASLIEGLRRLRHRAEDLRAERDTIQLEARGKAAVVAKPLVEHLMAEQLKTAQSVMSAYAALSGLTMATGGFQSERSLLHEAISGLHGRDGLLGYVRAAEVPEELREVIDALDGKGEAFQPAKLGEIPLY
ncbi:MAG: hypothetical protein B7Y88_04205 [Sphingomonadales bacterium 32-64-17]|nr:MAG: hypothetical protein B7Y88_04205 [Sphingomonadales bacterium 32-64-17]